MSALTNIIGKEIRELLTPATFLPIIIMAIIFGSMGNTFGGIEEQFEEPPIIGLINQDQGMFSELVESAFENRAEIIYHSTDIFDKNNALDKLQNNDGVALIIINNNFSKDILNEKKGQFEILWIMKGLGILDSLSSNIVQDLINYVNTNITIELISTNQSLNASTILVPTIRNETTYFKGRELNGLSPAQISNMLGSQTTFVPIIIMIIIMMAGQMVISSMAMEKENKTLETLLTLPVKRTSIVAGKIIGSASIGLILAMIYMFGYGYFLQSFQSQSNIILSNYNLTLTFIDILFLGLSIFITLVAALALCMLLGTTAKNYKSAQTLTFPVAMLALVPMIITMFIDFNTLPSIFKVIIFGIPFVHPMMAPRALIFNDYILVISGIIYVTIFALIIILLTVWIFKTDRLLTGISKGKNINFYKFKRK